LGGIQLFILLLTITDVDNDETSNVVMIHRERWQMNGKNKVDHFKANSTPF
jgi:hypothetical protein